MLVLDKGAVPVTKVLAELGRLGYSGTFQIEYQGEEDPREAVLHNVKWLKEQMKK